MLRTTVPTLLLCAAVLAAVEDTPDRAIRQQETAQRGVSSQAVQTAAKADLLADQLRFNRVGDDSDAAAISQLSGQLGALVEGKGEVKTMSWVEDRLAKARRGGGEGDLGAASGAQAEIANRLDEMAKKAQGAMAADGVQALRSAIDAQQRLQDETAKQADQTLGKERSELSTQERSELEKLARQERNLEKALDDAAKALREQANQASDPQEKKNLEDAAKQLENSQAKQNAKEAADQLSENKMAEAQEKQQQVMDALQQADKALSGMKRDEMAELDKKMQQMQQLQQQQQNLMEQMQSQEKPSQAEMNSMEAKEQEIAKALQEMQQDKAAEAAQQAQKDLQKQDAQQAKQDMQKALDAMKQAQQQMQQQMQQMAQQQAQQQQQQQQAQQPQKPQPDSKEGAQKTGDDSDLKEGDGAKKGKGAWKVSLAPGERETLNQSSADKFPSRYESALVQYYKALAGEGGEP